MRKPILLDMDNGCGIPMADVDDALALALALNSPEVDLRGCTACAGNCRAAESAANTLRLLELAGRDDIPVAVGPETPLTRNRDAHFAYLDAKRLGAGSRFWKNMPAMPKPARKPDPRPAPCFMAETAMNTPDGITLVCTGSLTNAALMLRDFPEAKPHIREIIHMGGAWPAEADKTDWENATPDIPEDVWRETLRFNPLYDPEASEAIFRSGIPVTVVPANVTMTVFLRPDALAPLKNSGNKFRRFLHDACMPWVNWSMAVRQLPGAHQHDPLALAIAIRPDLCRYESMAVDVTALLEPRGNFLREHDSSPKVRVARQVAAELFESFFSHRL